MTDCGEEAMVLVCAYEEKISRKREKGRKFAKVRGTARFKRVRQARLQRRGELILPYNQLLDLNRYVYRPPHMYSWRRR